MNYPTYRYTYPSNGMVPYPYGPNPAEGPFVQHLRQYLNKKIRVRTYCEQCEGILRGVFSDYIYLVNEDAKRHIRIDSICCFAEKKE